MRKESQREAKSLLPKSFPFPLTRGGGVDAIDTISQIPESLHLVLIKPLAKPPRRPAV